MKAPSSRHHSAFCILHSALALAVATATAGAATYYASPTGAADAACTADDPGTIQAAVNKAANGTSWETGDEVVLLPGTYDYSDPVWSGKNCVDIPKNKNYLTIRSASGNPSDTILLGRGGETYVSEDLLTTNEPFSSQAVYLNSKALLKGLTITNFHTTAGSVIGAVSYHQYINLEHCLIAGNVAQDAPVSHGTVANDSAFIGNSGERRAGVVLCNAVPVYFTNCVFAANSGANGVAYRFVGDMVNCVFSNNVSTSESTVLVGGNPANVADSLFIGNSSTSCTALKSMGTNVVRNCHFIRNYASVQVGAVLGGVYTNCTFIGNSTPGKIGAALNISAYNCSFRDNWAGDTCGAVSGDGTLSGCLFSNNWAYGHSGAYAAGKNSHLITNCVFIGNGSQLGTGGVTYGGYQVVYDSEFLGNTATNGYGGVNYNGGTYINCRFEGNRAKDYGASSGGIYTNCAFIRNYASHYGGAAAGITASRCLFQDNWAASRSGAIIGSNQGRLATECVFIRNGAIDYGLVSDVELRNCLVVSNETTGTVTGLTSGRSSVNCTFVGNRTGSQGVLASSASNVILHGNEPYDIADSYITLDHCLYGTRTGSRATLAGCIQTNNPHFNLGYNPKLAWYAPRKRSPARDAGAEQSWAADSLDLAGNGRLNGPIDIGCYEFWPSTDGTKVLLR